MGQLLVRKVNDDLIRRLKERAAMAGRISRRSIGCCSNKRCGLVSRASSSALGDI